MPGSIFQVSGNLDSVGFSQQAITGVAVAHMFLSVYAHMCSTEAGCSSMGPRWLIYPTILSWKLFLPILPMIFFTRSKQVRT